MATLGAAIKAAFKWHWNLLALGAGVVFSFLSGRPETFLPLVAAAELGFLGLLGTNARFQRVVGAMQAGPPAGPQAPDEETIGRIIGFLSREDRERFEALRDRVFSLSELARQLSPTGNALAQDQFNRIRNESLDKLLWVFLRLLHHKNTLDSFLDEIDRPALAKQMEQTARDHEAALAKQPDSRLAASLGEKLSTMRDRLANVDKAGEDRVLLRVEIDKTEQKIVQICEMGIASRDPGGVLSQQVDGIAGTVAATEQALSGLNLSDLFETEKPPNLLPRTRQFE